MKNIINYFYGIIIKEYKKTKKKFVFNIDNYKFEFVEYYGNINELVNLYSILIEHGKEVDEIVLNKKNSFITYYENKPYILIKKNKNLREELTIKNIIEYDSSVYKKSKINWKNLWIEKIDYYELQLEELGSKYPILKESFTYYLGMSELGINLLNYIDDEGINLSIAHKRIKKFDDLYNPLNIIIDNRVRDIVEYIKTKFFYGDLNLTEITSFFYKNFFTNNELILFISRLLYASYYFDIFDKFYNDSGSEKELIQIIKKNTDYEVFLKKIYFHVKNICNIPQIEFLEN